MTQHEQTNNTEDTYPMSKLTRGARVFVVCDYWTIDNATPRYTYMHNSFGEQVRVPTHELLALVGK